MHACPAHHNDTGGKSPTENLEISAQVHGSHRKSTASVFSIQVRGLFRYLGLGVVGMLPEYVFGIADRGLGIYP